MATRSRIGLFAFWTHALLACGGAATEAAPATVTVHPERDVHAEVEVHTETEADASPVLEAPVIAPSAAPLPEVLTEERSIDAIVAWSRDWLGSTRSEEELAIAEAQVPVFPSEPARCAWAEERFEVRKQRFSQAIETWIAFSEDHARWDYQEAGQRETAATRRAAREQRTANTFLLAVDEMDARALLSARLVGRDFAPEWEADWTRLQALAREVIAHCVAAPSTSIFVPAGTGSSKPFVTSKKNESATSP